MTADLFALAEADDAAGLGAALTGTDLTRLHNEAGESLYRFALFHGHAKAAEAVKARGGFGPHDAALTNDTARLKTLLEGAGWAVDLLSPDGWTALHLAAFVGADDAVEALLMLGANARVFGRAFEQNLAIHAAAAGRRIGRRAFEALVAATGDPDVRQKQGYTALMIAASNGFELACKVLLAAGADRSMALPDGKTAAAIALERGYAALAERLG
jgi:ankyrin repeat protein